MTKTATWKKNRDICREHAESGDKVDINQLRDLVKGAGWETAWSDFHDESGQMAWFGAMRSEYDECCPIVWKVFRGWGDTPVLVLKTSLKQFEDVLKNPPPPRLMSHEIVLGDMETEVSA